MRCRPLFNLEKQCADGLDNPRDARCRRCGWQRHLAVFGQGDRIASTRQNGSAFRAGPDFGVGVQCCADGQGAPISDALAPSQLVAREVGDRPSISRQDIADLVGAGFAHASEQQNYEKGSQQAVPPAGVQADLTATVLLVSFLDHWKNPTVFF